MFNSHDPLPTLTRSTPMSACVTVTLLTSWVAAAGAAAAADVSEPYSATTSLQSRDWGLPMVVVAVSAAVLLLLLVIILVINCGDCYNSEVSSDFHPATGHSEVRWGGASGYRPAATSDPMLSSGFTGEVVIPGGGGEGGQALPYTMIPSQVPEAQGFRGYGTPAGGGSSGAQGFSGYSSQPAGGGGVGGGGGGGGRAQYLPGAHVSPVSIPEPEEPPPSYFSSTNH